MLRLGACTGMRESVPVITSAAATTRILPVTQLTHLWVYPLPPLGVPVTTFGCTRDHLWVSRDSLPFCVAYQERVTRQSALAKIRATSHPKLSPFNRIYPTVILPAADCRLTPKARCTMHQACTSLRPSRDLRRSILIDFRSPGPPEAPQGSPG